MVGTFGFLETGIHNTVCFHTDTKGTHYLMRFSKTLGVRSPAKWIKLRAAKTKLEN